MMDITVKTLDGQNRTYSVPEDITVKQFKEKIAGSIKIPAETQRLIFQGKVLQDDKLMKDYDIHGKVVHVVVRPPPSSTRPSSNIDNPQPNTTTPGRDVNSIVVGSFTLPSDILDANMVQGIAQNVIRSMGDLGRNARVSTRTSNDGSALDVHIHLGPIQSGQTVSEAQMRLNTAQTMIRLANDSLERLENATPGSGSRSDTPRSSSPASNREAESSPSDTQAREASTRLSPMDTSEEPTSSQQTPDDASADVGSTNTETETSSATNQNEAAARSTQSDAAPGSSSQDQNDQNQQPQRPIRPNITALGEVLTDLNELTQRLQPHMQRFTEIVRNDTEMNDREQRENQRVCNHVSEVMHAFSHGYHALSDLMVDLSQSRPRQLYVTLAIAHPHTTVIQQTIPVQAEDSIDEDETAHNMQSDLGFPITRSGSSTSTTSTGTSTTPAPRTTETGTQPTVPSTTETGTQPASTTGSQGDGDDVERISQEMRAGLENVFGQGLHQGDGSPDNPYVYVEMGPDTMTVNSISAQVVTSTDDELDQLETGSSDTPTSTPVSTPASVSTTTTTAGPQVPAGSQGLPQTGLPPNFLQGIMQQILQQTGTGMQPQRMQINIGQVPPQMPPPGMPMGFRLGPHMVRTGGPRNNSGTQTAGSNGVPANNGTQTSAAPTSTFGTQTTSTTPSSTSGTQTPSVPTAFMLPGGVQNGVPLRMPGPFPGAMPSGLGLNPADPYLPCSSRHFLTRHAANLLNSANNNQQQTNDTVLADMVGNLMSGLLGGATGTGATSSTAVSTASSTAGSGGGTRTTGGVGQPRPATSTGAATFSLNAGQPRSGGPLFRGPFTLGNLFPGRMPTLTGMRFQVRAPRAAGPAPPPATGSGNTGSSTTATSSASSTTEPNFVQMLRSTLQQSSQGQRTGTTQATSTTPSSTAGTTRDQNQNVETGPQYISDEAFTQLVSRIITHMSQAAGGQAPTQTVGDFIRTIGENYPIPQGEGFVNDVLSCILAHLQITDLLQLFYGNSAPFNQVQVPLREFLSRSVLNDEPPSEENIRSGVGRIIENMQSDIQDMVNSAAPRPHIDFLATTNRFLTQQFFNVVFLIMNSRERDPNFGRDLYACIRRLLAEMLVLCSRCLGGMQQVERFVSERLRNLIAGVNPVIQEWMSAVNRRQLSTFIPTITVTEGEVSVYLVNKRPGQAAGSSTSASASHKTPATKKNEAGSKTESKVASPKESVKREPSPLDAPSPKRTSKAKEVVKSPVTPMETSPQMSSPGASEMEVETQKQTTSAGGGAGASDLSLSKSIPSAENQPSPSGAQASNGDWQSVVPADWVPVITQDIESQKTQSKQAPYSDVYLQGVPPKRRRLMTQDRPVNISNTSEVLPEALRRAVAAAAVEPISNMDNLMSEINNDSDLQQSFEGQVSSTINERLNNDSDYREERFPVSNEYFHKTNDKKK